MRIAGLILLTVLLAGPSAQAKRPPKVIYTVEGSAGSWQPITPADLARAVEHAALEALTKPGLMQLERHAGPGANQAAGEYTLEIRGHILDEAETHTVFLEFGPGTETDVPSLSASRTVRLSGLKRGQMLRRVEASAREAARALVKALKEPLQRARAGAEHPTVEDPFSGAEELPWKWADVRVPRPRMGDAARDLYSRKEKLRQAALRELTSLALTERTPAQVLERCALEHQDDDTRLGCLEALRPISRRVQPTQRVVVEVFRKDPDRSVRREASDQMLYFTGVSQAAAIQAWLEAAAAGREYGPLDRLGDLANLDLAVRRCLETTGRRDTRSNRPRFGCLKLLEPVPYARRRAILWRFVQEMNPKSPYYLEGAGEREGSRGTPWGRAVKALVEDMPAWDPALEDALWRRYQRTLSHTAMTTLSGHGAPSERLAKRLLEIVKTRGENRALNGVRRMAVDSPELRPMIREALVEMMEMGTHHKDLNRRSFERALASIERAVEREEER